MKWMPSIALFLRRTAFPGRRNGRERPSYGICFAAEVMAVALAGGWATAAAEPAPALVIQQAEINAGDVLAGDPKLFTFELNNAGQAPLTITAEPTCRCTLVSVDQEIRPGDTGKVQVEGSTFP